MDRITLEHAVARAEELVRQGEQNVRDQHALIERMNREGLDTRVARVILKTFERSLQLETAERDRLKAELSKRSEAA